MAESADTPADTQVEVEKELRTLLFLGQIPPTKNDDKQPHWKWYELGDTANDGSKLDILDERVAVYTGKNLVTGPQPGTIITIQGKKGCGTVYPGTSKIVGRWDNDEDVTHWTATFRALTMEIEATKKAVSEIRRRLPLAALEPIRTAWWNARNRRQKAHIVAMVIDAITSPKELGKDTGDRDDW